MYHIVLVILFIYSFFELATGRKNKFVFNVVYSLMTFIAIFKYGQMDDYFRYYLQYESPENTYLIIDPLFGLLILFFKTLSLSYYFFIGFLSFVSMALAYRFFSRDCGRSSFALFVFYCYIFFVCCPLGAFRQGLCVAILLYVYHFLKENKYKLFYFYTIIGCFIHLSFVVVLIIPFFLHWRIFNKTYIFYILIGVAVLAVVGISFAQFLPISRITYYEEGEGQNIWIRLLLRILLIFPVLLYKPPFGTDGYNSKAICIVGFSLYCLLSFNDLVAARLEFYFRIFICLFVSYLIFSKRITFSHRICLSLLLFVHLFLWGKNIDAAIDRMGYNQGTTVFNFPFISVFDKSELRQYSSIETYNYDD